VEGKKTPRPPRLPDRFLRWFCADEVLETLQGDLYELFEKRRVRKGKLLADLYYTLDVLSACRSFAFKRNISRSNSNSNAMLQHYFKTSLRSLLKDKTYALTNIFCLSLGVATFFLTSLWLYDEVTFDMHNRNGDRIAQVMQHNTFNGSRRSFFWQPYHLDDLISQKYGDDFEYVVMSSYPSSFTLKYQQEKIQFNGAYMSFESLEMLDLKMTIGDYHALKEPYSVVISETIAHAFFGETNPLGQIITIRNIDRNSDVQVTGVYEDLPENSSFSELAFIMPWKLIFIQNPRIKIPNPWENLSFLTYVKLNDNSDFEMASARIKNLKKEEISEDQSEQLKPEVFLHPMSKWRLYSSFKDGGIAGGRIELVRIFGVSGLFVLLLACVNFINLATAQVQSRSKGIGIQKVLGAGKMQLIGKLLFEYFIVSLVSLVLGLLIVQLITPFFNEIAEKSLGIPVTSLSFWCLCFLFCMALAVFAGVYPAVYLSSLDVTKAIKGSLKSGPGATLQRKTLVVFQFSVSIILIIGTVVIFLQIRHSKNRSIGYEPDLLVTASSSPDILKHIDVFRSEVIASGAVVDVVQSSNRLTEFWNVDDGFDWEGKEPGTVSMFPVSYVSAKFGSVIGWEISRGRDFLPESNADSLSFIINESAVRFMNLTDPIGSVISWNGTNFKVVGVIKDIVFESPYQNVRPYIYHRANNQGIQNTFKLSKDFEITDGINEIRKVYEKFLPDKVVELTFVDQEFNKKFREEERVGNLATLFSTVAIILSCIGIFGLAKFITAQRTKEIAIRKVLGSTSANLWTLLSKDFVVLSTIALVLSTPLAYYFVGMWLQNYPVRVDLPLWIFMVIDLGVVTLALSVVGVNIHEAVRANPVEALNVE